MRRTLYRVLYTIGTSYMAFMISIPIIEKRGLDATLIDDASAVLFWVIGFLLMFTKKYYRVGMFLAFFPILFILAANYIVRPDLVRPFSILSHIYFKINLGLKTYISG